MLTIDYKIILKIFQVWSWGFVVRSVVGMLAALDAKKALHLGLHIHRKPSDFPPEPCRQVLYCCWPVHSGFCSIHRSLLDWSRSSLEHFVSTSSYVTCKQRPPFFLFTPQSPHEALQAHLIPPLCFHFKMFNFTYYLLLWIWAPAVLTCSSSPSLPASHAQFLILLPCICLCWSLYHPRCYCLPNSDSSAAAKVPEGSPLEKPEVFKQMPFRARLSSVVTSAHCRRGLMPRDHTSEAWG